MKKLIAFLLSPRYNTLMFWVSLGIALFNLALMLPVARQIPNSQDLQHLLLLNGALGVVGAVTAWIRERMASSR